MVHSTLILIHKPPYTSLAFRPFKHFQDLLLKLFQLLFTPSYITPIERKFTVKYGLINLFTYSSAPLSRMIQSERISPQQNPKIFKPIKYVSNKRSKPKIF